MKITGQEGKTLLALRGGPTGSMELYERFPTGASTTSLVRKGLIEQKGGDYYITELGRQHCPVRRQPKQATEKTLPVLLQEQTAKKVVSKPETITVTPVFNIVKAVPTVKAVPEKETEMITPTETKAEKSKVLMMLEYIEQHPNCTSNEINQGLGFAVGKKFIPSYIEKGLVEVTTNRHNKSAFRLKDGFTAQQVYETRRHANKSTANVTQSAVHITPAVEKAPAETLPEAFEIPSFLTQPQIKLDLESPVQSAVDGTHVPKPAQSGRFRCAYTNDGCLMLLGIQLLPIKLNAAQTNDLIEFISETITPIGVSM